MKRSGNTGTKHKDKKVIRMKRSGNTGRKLKDEKVREYGKEAFRLRKFK